MSSFQALLAYISPDRRAALAAGTELPTHTHGAALWADLSGFTPLTEVLVSHLGERQGADELAIYLNRIYSALIAPVEAHGGSVIDFSGDAVTCWFEADDGQLVVAAACAMQVAMRPFESLQLPTGERISLGIKVAIACGAVRRFRVGDPAIQYLDTMIGPVMDHLALASGLACTGEILLDESVVNILPVSEWRSDPSTGRRVAVLNCPEHLPVTWSALPAQLHSLGEEQIRSWLLPEVFACIQGGQGEFLTELCPAVALFICFEGFHYDDEQIYERLNALICHTQRILMEYDGTLLQLTLDDKGSYIYAAFGAPTSHEDDIIRATAAALKLRHLPETLPGIQSIRMGMSQGVMRTGSYGCETRRTYGVLGEDVNLAARLMQKAAPGQILASESVWQENTDFRWRTLPVIKVKGRQTPVQPAELLGWREQNALDLPQITAALPMIGRQAELVLLHEKMTLALHGHGQIVSIVGEAGLGKSRLLAEALQQAGAFARHGGECQSYGMQSSYTVWLPIWLSFFGQAPATSTAEQIRGIEQALAQIHPDFAQRLPLLDTVLNLSIPDNGLTDGMDAKTRKTLREALLVDCARNRAAQSPLIFILEDLHWIDPLSLDLLEALARAIQSLPVLIFLTYRPLAADRTDGFLPAFTGLPHHTQIYLTELATVEIEQLIVSRLSAPVTPALVQHLFARTQGNPFYLEELINYQLDQGHDPRAPSIWEQGDLPESLHSLILSRIDQLGEHQQITIKAASVIGRFFRAAWLYEYCPFLNAAQAVEDLKTLHQLGFVVQDAPEPQLSYLFKHVITQEVAYENLAYATRASLHEYFASYLERVAGDDVYSYLDLLVYHYEHSENLPKKRIYLRKAGEAAQKAYANEAAIDYLGKALALTPKDDDAEQFEILFARQDVYSLLMNRDAENADLQALAALADALDDNTRRAKVALRQSNYAYFTGNYQAAAEFAQKAVKLAHLAKAYDVEALAYVRWSDTLVRRGNAKEAHFHAKKALALSEKIKNDNLIALSSLSFGIYAVDTGNLEQAQIYFHRALEIYQSGGYKRNEPVALYNIAMMLSYSDLFKAQDYYEQALTCWRAMGDRRFESIVLSQIAYLIFECRSDYGKAREYCEQAFHLSTELLDQIGEIATFYSLAAIDLAHNHYLPAQAQFQKALDLCIKIGYPLYQGTSLVKLGIVFCQLGNFERALECCNQAILLLRDVEDIHELSSGLIALGKLHYYLQDYAAAQETYYEVLSIAQKSKNKLEHAHALVFQGHLLLELDDLPQAAKAYQHGLALALELGLDHYAKQAQTGLSWIAFKQGNRAEAFALLDEILLYLSTRPLSTIDEIFWMYLTCYRMLQARAHPQAVATLRAAHTLLQSIAAPLQGPALRDSFLQNVRFNRQICEAWQSLSIDLQHN